MNNYFSQLAKYTGLQIGPRRTAGRSPVLPLAAMPVAAPLEVEEMRLIGPPLAPEFASREAAFPDAESQPVERGAEPARLSQPLDLSPSLADSPEREPAPANRQNPQVDTSGEHTSKAVPAIAHRTIEIDGFSESSAPLLSRPLEQPSPQAASAPQATVRIGGAAKDANFRIGGTTREPAETEVNEIEMKVGRTSPSHSIEPRSFPAQSPNGSETAQLIASWQDVQEWINAAPDVPGFDGAVTDERTTRPMSSLEIPELSDLAAAGGREPEVQDFQLSIGNISIVVESLPQAHAPLTPPPPRASQPPEPKREVSRLSRHYIQVR